MMVEITRDQMREHWANSGLSLTSDVVARLPLLRRMINARMISAGLMRRSYRCNQRWVITQRRLGMEYTLRCRSYYFDNREAVTFNPDGFIGFAGWADVTNVQPILQGFFAWVALVREET